MSFLKKAVDRLQVIGHAMRIGNVAAARNADEAVNKAQLDAVKPYRCYVALLTQTGSNAPVATVLENTIGTITWSRNSDGSYTATRTGAFTANKTMAQLGYLDDQLASGIVSVVQPITSTDGITISTGQVGGSGIDGLLYKTFFEIRVYNS